MTFPAENIRDWADKDVVDPANSKIGTLEQVYFDTGSDAASFLSVRIGMIGRHRLVFVPLAGATVSPTSVKVAFDKKLVRDSPAIDTDGEMTSEQEPVLFAYHGLPYQLGASGERRLGRH